MNKRAYLHNSHSTIELQPTQMSSKTVVFSVVEHDQLSTSRVGQCSRSTWDVCPNYTSPQLFNEFRFQPALS